MGIVLAHLSWKMVKATGKYLLGMFDVEGDICYMKFDQFDA